MALKPRIHYPGALYHVILQGNARQDIFFDDEDRYRFYLLVQEGVERFGHQAHAFCLMTNHIHLALGVLSANIVNISPQRRRGAENFLGSSLRLCVSAVKIPQNVCNMFGDTTKSAFISVLNKGFSYMMNLAQLIAQSS